MVFTIFFLSFFLYSPWNSPGQNTGVGSHSPSPGDLPNPGIEPRSPSLQADLLPAEPQGKFKNTVVGSLSLLQGIPQPRNRTRVSWIAGGFFTWVLPGKPPFWTKCLSKSGSYKATLTGSGILKVKVLLSQSCLTLWNPMDCSPPGYSVHGIFQARILEWITISFSRWISPTQELNPGVLHYRQILYHLSHHQ